MPALASPPVGINNLGMDGPMAGIPRTEIPAGHAPLTTGPFPPQTGQNGVAGPNRHNVPEIAPMIDLIESSDPEFGNNVITGGVAELLNPPSPPSPDATPQSSDAPQQTILEQQQAAQAQQQAPVAPQLPPELLSALTTGDFYTASAMIAQAAAQTGAPLHPMAIPGAVVPPEQAVAPPPVQAPPMPSAMPEPDWSAVAVDSFRDAVNKSVRDIINFSGADFIPNPESLKGIFAGTEPIRFPEGFDPMTATAIRLAVNNARQEARWQTLQYQQAHQARVQQMQAQAQAAMQQQQAAMRAEQDSMRNNVLTFVKTEDTDKIFTNPETGTANTVLLVALAKELGNLPQFQQKRAAQRFNLATGQWQQSVEYVHTDRDILRAASSLIKRIKGGGNGASANGNGQAASPPPQVPAGALQGAQQNGAAIPTSVGGPAMGGQAAGMNQRQEIRAKLPPYGSRGKLAEVRAQMLREHPWLTQDHTIFQ